MNNNDELKNKMIEWGAEKVGYADLKAVLPEEYKHLSTGISFVIRLSDEIISQIKDSPTHTYFHHYRSVNTLIDQISLKASIYLQNLGYLAMPIAASQSVNGEGRNYEGVFQHKTTATLAGIGWIGKSACLITQEYGPRVRLGTVLTNMTVKVDQPMVLSLCGNCNTCVDNCPAMAIRGKLWNQEVAREEFFDAKACSVHMHKKYQHIGRGAVCGICIKSCPKGTQVIKR